MQLENFTLLSNAILLNPDDISYDDDNLNGNSSKSAYNSGMLDYVRAD